ncbi:MAG: hypothetical protein ACM3U2_11795, partial [Deltaproteobacteria bacterium]
MPRTERQYNILSLVFAAQLRTFRRPARGQEITDEPPSFFHVEEVDTDPAILDLAGFQLHGPAPTDLPQAVFRQCFRQRRFESLAAGHRHDPGIQLRAGKNRLAFHVVRLNCEHSVTGRQTRLTSFSTNPAAVRRWLRHDVKMAGGARTRTSIPSPASRRLKSRHERTRLSLASPALDSKLQSHTFTGTRICRSPGCFARLEMQEPAGRWPQGSWSA